VGDAQPTQVLVFYRVKELTIENSSKVKARKFYLLKSERERLPISQKCFEQWGLETGCPQGHWGDSFYSPYQVLWFSIFPGSCFWAGPHCF
jgi:hypothetical protein